MSGFYLYAFLNGSIPATGNEEWQLQDYKIPFQPFYVGKGINERLYEHFAPSNLTRETPFYRKLRKLIRENHFDDTLHIIKLYENLTEEDAWQKEKELVIYWGRKTKKNEGWGMLYNVADGGIGGNTLTDFNREQVRESHRKRMKIVVNDSYRQKCSDAHKELWKNRDPTKTAAHISSIQKQIKDRALRSLEKYLGKEISKIIYHCPFGSFELREAARQEAERLWHSAVPQSTWREWFFERNSQIIGPTISADYRNVKRIRESKAWEYPMLHQFEGKTFHEAGFYIEVYYKDQSREALHGEQTGRNLQ